MLYIYMCYKYPMFSHMFSPRKPIKYPKTCSIELIISIETFIENFLMVITKFKVVEM